MSFAEEHRSKVMWELDGVAAQLNRSAVDPTRLAFLVNEDEWEQVEAYVKRFSYITGYENFELPLKEITYRGIEVRKR